MINDKIKAKKGKYSLVKEEVKISALLSIWVFYKWIIRKKTAPNKKTGLSIFY